MDNSKNWWQSKTIQGAVIQILVLLSLFLGFDLGDAEATNLVQAICGGVGAVMTIWGRFSAKTIIK